MNREERLQALLRAVKDHGGLNAKQLSGMFYISLPTVYRDLRELSRQKLLVHHEGLYKAAQDKTVTVSLNARYNSQKAKKEKIASAALPLLQDDSVLFFDASTTVSCIISFLSGFHGLTVLTNGIATAIQLNQNGIKTYFLGGQVQENSMAVGGRIAMETLEHFEIDCFLFSAYGLTTQGVIVDTSEREAALRRHILSKASTSIFLCDSSKIGKRSVYNIASLACIDYMITDKELPDCDLHTRKRIIIV